MPRAASRIPGLLIEAGGQQTLSASDGSFLLEGLPPGIHNLVGFAMDGKYRTFQQGAQVAAQSTTPAAISLQAAPLVNVVFVAKLPGNTPPVIPVRLAGSLYQTGNTFATLSGGISTIASNMPVLDPLPDGRYSVTLQLPAGADLRYKYTLGDGFWNAEHNRSDGQFRLRQIVIPDKNTLVEDEVDTWSSGNQAPITFDLRVPENTPTTDFVSIQFNPAVWVDRTDPDVAPGRPALGLRAIQPAEFTIRPGIPLLPGQPMWEGGRRGNGGRR